ncbi:MAG TPA: YrhC family protein [Lentibacillus sp.]|uniref:YrhC family protein n=1 Tax=Lentibacillus sp. TaxID=1925746 RepID=UPI002B4B8380|nr:YrhC family protein [Lentibacillus sp.]HLR61088.1 YrhC family protein [Lentibacillus sp.]
MRHQKQKKETKLADYRRFTVTLLILASYLYMGAVINTHINYSADGKALTLLSFASAAIAGWFSFRTRRLGGKLQK